MCFTSSGSWIKLQIAHIHIFINFNNSSLISASIAIVWRRKQSNHMFIMSLLIAFHNKLMCSINIFNIIKMYKLFTNILSKSESRTSWWHIKSTSIIRIRPKQITHGSLMWYFLGSIKLFYVIQAVNWWTKSAV